MSRMSIDALSTKEHRGRIVVADLRIGDTERERPGHGLAEGDALAGCFICVEPGVSTMPPGVMPAR